MSRVLRRDRRAIPTGRLGGQISNMFAFDVGEGWDGLVVNISTFMVETSLGEDAPVPIFWEVGTVLPATGILVVRASDETFYEPTSVVVNAGGFSLAVSFDNVGTASDDVLVIEPGLAAFRRSGGIVNSSAYLRLVASSSQAVTKK